LVSWFTPLRWSCQLKPRMEICHILIPLRHAKAMRLAVGRRGNGVWA
jgi:hypothetical protein